MRRSIILAFLIITTAVLLNAEVRFVSKTGTSKPPYTSWATAADSIQKAINICNPGDTIYVGNGVYQDTVRMRPGIALIGSGIDSCVINVKNINKDSIVFAIIINDSCTIKGFSILPGNNKYGNLKRWGITAWGNVFKNSLNKCSIENNRIEGANIGFNSTLINGIIRNNFLINNIDYGIYNSPLLKEINEIIENNVITGALVGIRTDNGFYNIIGNTIVLNSGSKVDRGILTVGGVPSISNNLIISKGGNQTAIYASAVPTSIYNNLIYGEYLSPSVYISKGHIVKNNVLLNSFQGFDILSKESTVQYNNIWNVKNPYMDNTPDSTNISVDPMFVNPDSLDFHLQKYSPMIDAGDPAINDKDGTRSDIGLFGGPYGESYTYKDLAPRPPVNITLTKGVQKITLNWNKNSEADFSFYRVYRDTMPGFIPDTTKRIAKTNDTAYTELFKLGRNYYYKISATDKQGNESPKSEEVKLITGVNEKPVIQTEDYTLFANHPNPFNPSTKICYRLRKAGSVSLRIYDIKGSLVKQILNKWQEAGYYEEEFTGEKGQTNNYLERFASGVYILWMDVKDENNIPVYTNSRKMMMLK